MPEVELLAAGEGDYRLHDPDALRAWMRDRKRRDTLMESTLLVASVEAVTEEMGVKPRMAECVADLAPPTADGLEILRDQIDSGRSIIGRTAKR